MSTVRGWWTMIWELLCGSALNIFLVYKVDKSLNPRYAAYIRQHSMTAWHSKLKVALPSGFTLNLNWWGTKHFHSNLTIGQAVCFPWHLRFVCIFNFPLLNTLKKKFLILFLKNLTWHGSWSLDHYQMLWNLPVNGFNYLWNVFNVVWLHHEGPATW